LPPIIKKIDAAAKILTDPHRSRIQQFDFFLHLSPTLIGQSSHMASANRRQRKAPRMTFLHALSPCS